MRAAPEFLAVLDEWIAEQPEPRPSRSEAVRRLVEHAVRGPGRPDAVLIRRNLETGTEEKIAVEFKPSIRDMSAAVRQLETYLQRNPEFVGGIAVIGSEDPEGAN